MEHLLDLEQIISHQATSFNTKIAYHFETVKTKLVVDLKHKMSVVWLSFFQRKMLLGFNELDSLM